MFSLCMCVYTYVLLHKRIKVLFALLRMHFCPVGSSQGYRPTSRMPECKKEGDEEPKAWEQLSRFLADALEQGPQSEGGTK